MTTKLILVFGMITTVIVGMLFVIDEVNASPKSSDGKVGKFQSSIRLDFDTRLNNIDTAKLLNEHGKSVLMLDSLVGLYSI